MLKEIESCPLRGQDATHRPFQASDAVPRTKLAAIFQKRLKERVFKPVLEANFPSLGVYAVDRKHRPYPFHHQRDCGKSRQDSFTSSDDDGAASLLVRNDRLTGSIPPWF